MQWLRLYAEFASDPKVQRMSESYQRRLIMLFCMKCDGHGDAPCDDDVTFVLRISDDEWRDTKREFVARGFIDEHNNLLNWEERQKRSDSSAERTRAYRDRKKQERDVTVTPQNRTEENREEKRRKKKESAFALPDWIEKKDWDDFEELRRSKRKPMTDRARSLAVGELDRLRSLGHAPSSLIQTAILKGWDTFYPPKDNSNPVVKFRQ